MASGGDFSHSLYSDQVFDQNCDVCEDDNTVSEAVCYCTVCYKYYCTECRNIHSKFHRDHRDKLLNKAAMLKKTQPKRPAPVALTTRCEEHQNEVVNMYCYDHDVVCCTVCLAIHHKRCGKADYVPQIADGFSKSPDVAKTKHDLQNVRKDLVAVKSFIQTDQARIKKEKERVLEQIEESRRKMNAVFDKLEQAVIRGADTRYYSYIVNTQTDLQECDAAIRRIEKSIDDLEGTDNQNEAQTFVNVKKGAEGMDDWRNIVNQMQDKVGQQKITFNVDNDIQEYLDRIKSLGEFVDEYRERGPLRAKGQNVKGMERTYVNMLKVVSKHRAVVKHENALMKMKEDSSRCCIYGSCCLPDGGALLSDNWNDKLKRLNRSHQITNTCSIKGPIDVCYIKDSHEAAVCVDRAIKIVSLGKQMEVVRAINIGGINCFSVAYCNGLLYANAGDTLFVYDYATGKLCHTVHTDSQGKKIFSKTQDVATNADGTRIWVADQSHGLIQIDQHYNAVRVVKINEMHSPSGVCVDNEDNVYVCGWNPNIVLQLTSSGEKVRTLCGPDELPAGPCSVSYDNKQSRLLVTIYDTDTLKVIHFK